MRLNRFYQNGNGKKKEVLLLDDEEEIGWIMGKFLRDAGHRFSYVCTASEAIKKVKASKNLDMVIVDFKLSDGNGLGFIKKARSINNRVRFAMLTAHGTAEVRKKANDLGVDYFLDKPLRIEKLLDIVAKDC